MIRYADRHQRPMPSIADWEHIREATRAELAAKATGRVMEIVETEPAEGYTESLGQQEFDRPLDEEPRQVMHPRHAEAYKRLAYGTETGRMPSDKPLCRRCGQPMPEGQGYEHLGCDKPPSACQRVSDYRQMAEKAEEDEDGSR